MLAESNLEAKLWLKSFNITLNDITVELEASLILTFLELKAKSILAFSG